MARKKPGFKSVDFFSGINTPSKKDDKKVSFVARNLGKKSPLPRPKKARALRKLRARKDEFGFGSGGLPGVGINTGLAEKSGSKFDDVFGLGRTKERNPFESKIGLDLNFGKGSFDTKFSKAFVSKQLDFKQPPFEQQFGGSTMISDDFEENPDIESSFEDQLEDNVPSLLESLPNVQSDRDEDDQTISKSERLDKKFLDIRQEALETGSNPLSPEEQRNFESGPKFTRNFGTTGKRVRGLGTGRF